MTADHDFLNEQRHQQLRTAQAELQADYDRAYDAWCGATTPRVRFRLRRRLTDLRVALNAGMKAMS